ncbi:DUF3526 domain-containing protein [Spirosoma arcticum]
MNELSILIRTEWLLLTRGQTLRWLLGLLAGAGLYAIFYGQTEVRRQRETMASISRDEQARAGTLRSALTLDTTLAGNAKKWELARDPYRADMEGYRFAIHPPGPITAFSLGQRDLFPTYQGVTAGSLLRQLDPTELANPQKLLIGNFDLAFVLIYLLPLFIIALSYNLLSAETEAGTLPLLRSQPVGLGRVLAAKLLLRLGLVLGAVVLLIGLATLLTGATDAELLAQWLAVSVAYTLFWFGVVGLVITFQGSSAVNAMVLLGAWLVLVLVTPALVQQVLALTQPAPDYQGLQSQIREVFTKRPPKAENVQKYYQHHPELAGSDTMNADRYLMMSFYARNEVLDRQFTPRMVQLDEQGRRYATLVESLTGLMPAVNAQELFNRLAGTDEASRQDYLTQVSAFHERWKAFIIPRKFRGQPMTEADYAQLPRFTFVPIAPPGIGAGIGWLLLGAGLLGGLGIFRFNRQPLP